ncbi:MAG: hypothetical protein AB7S86_17955, partial [Hydrogenophaga sp.]|uniref:hypothetical protein n=1 Tax=Hydrogenophaga sp. TaxID=1904254 RepID=UPI003D0FD992
MTPKPLLNQLAELAHFHPRLLSVAWVSLSVESKVSLFEALLKRDGAPPQWLVDLVLRDEESEFVRFWVVKNATLTRSQAEWVAARDEPLLKIALPYSGGSFFQPTPPSIVHVGVEGIGLFWRFRAYATAGLAHLVRWIQEHEGDEEYASALHSGTNGFLSRDDVQQLFRDCTERWLEMDGMERAGHHKDASEAWMLCQTTRHHDAAKSMAFWLPTYPLTLDAMLELPDHLKSVLMQRVWITDEVRKFVQHVVAHPDSFSESLADAARHHEALK